MCCRAHETRKRHQKERFRDFKLDSQQYSTSRIHSSRTNLSKPVMWKPTHSSTKLSTTSKTSLGNDLPSTTLRHWHSCYSDYFLTLDWTRLQSIFNFWNRSTVSLAHTKSPVRKFSNPNSKNAICFCSCAALIVMIVALMEWRSCASNGTKGTPAKKKRPKKTNRPNDQQTKNNLVIPWKVKVKLWVNAGSQSFSSNK